MVENISELVAILNVDEPNYKELASLGPDVLPMLLELVLSGSPEVASSAACLAGFIEGPLQSEVILAGVNNDSDIVRIQAAVALENLPENIAVQPLLTLLQDDNVSVRKFAVSSAAKFNSSALQDKLRDIAQNDSDPGIQQRAASTLQQ